MNQCLFHQVLFIRDVFQITGITVASGVGKGRGRPWRSKISYPHYTRILLSQSPAEKWTASQDPALHSVAQRLNKSLVARDLDPLRPVQMLYRVYSIYMYRYTTRCEHDGA